MHASRQPHVITPQLLSESSFFLFLARCRFFSSILYHCHFLFRMESTLYVSPPDGVFLPRDHGLYFDISYVRIQSINQSINHRCRYFQHAYFIPTVGVRKERRI